MSTGLQGLLPRVFRRIRQQELSGRSAQIAYYLLFASFPALMVVVVLLGKVTAWEVAQPLESLLAMGLPMEIAEPLTKEMNQVVDPAATRPLFGLGLGLFLAARAVDSICKGVNAAWGIRDERPWTQRKVRVLGITAAGVAGVSLLVVLLSVEPSLRAWLSHRGDELGTARLSMMRWPILFFVLHSLVWLVYRLGAERRQGHGWISWGSLSASVGVVLVTVMFHYYVQNIVDLGATYGSFGSAIGLAAYCYFCAYSVLVGAAIDCELKHLGY